MHRILVVWLVLLIVLGLACAPSARPLSTTSIQRARILPAGAAGPIDLEPSQRANSPLEQVLPPLASPARLEHLTAMPAVTRREPERDADGVFRSLHDDLIGCYVKRLATHPTAHAHLTVDVLVGEDGRPIRVTTTGGALLGAEMLGCIERRVGSVEFAPPEGGGTSRVRVPLSFHPAQPCEEG